MRFTIVLGLEGVGGSFRFSTWNALGVPDFTEALNGVTNFGLVVALPCLGVKPSGCRVMTWFASEDGRSGDAGTVV